MALPQGTAAHVVRVLRLRVGDALSVFDGQGGEYGAEITALGRDQVRVALGAHQPIERESSVHITLLQSLARGERMDLIVQKATELGVSTIVPVSSEYSVVRLPDAARSRRVEHWRQVAVSACEQCGRNRIPDITEVLDVAAACSATHPRAQRYLLHVYAQQQLAAVLGSEAAPASQLGVGDAGEPERGRARVALLIGPEGGWSEQELAIAQQFKFRPVQLGPRVLRTETAPLAALAVVQAMCGDLG